MIILSNLILVSMFRSLALIINCEKYSLSLRILIIWLESGLAKYFFNLVLLMLPPISDTSPSIKLLENFIWSDLFFASNCSILLSEISYVSSLKLNSDDSWDELFCFTFSASVLEKKKLLPKIIKKDPKRKIM